MPRQVLGHACGDLRERRCVRVQVHEQQSAQRFDPHPGQPELVFVEVLHPVREAGVTQAPVAVVGPCVVRAHDDGGVAGAAQQPVRPMPAHVEEAAKPPVVAAHHEHGFVGDLEGQVVAGIAHVRLVADVVPGAREDRLLLPLVDVRIGVVACGHGAGAAGIVGQRLLELAKRRHRAHGGTLG